MKAIKQDWDAMLSRGIIPCFEYQISENDWLLVGLEFTDEGLEFSFDSDNKRCAFDGEIIMINDNRYLLPWDLDMSLDSHLEMINDNMTEGYLLVNGLCYCEG